jgi:Excalibur calcium-binding domain
MQQDRRTRHGRYFAFLFGVLLVLPLLSISALGSRAWAQDDDLNCADFPSQAAAQREYERDRSDPNNLDADNDGQACEDFDYSSSGTGGSGAADHQYRDSGAGGTRGAGTRGGGTRGAGTRGAGGTRGAADHQYGNDDVIKGTIPDRRLSNTGGSPLIQPAGALLLGAGLLLGCSVIRRAL